MATVIWAPSEFALPASLDTSAPPPPSGTFVPGAPVGTGWTTILAHTDTPIVIPSDFYGWHQRIDLVRRQVRKHERSWDVGSGSTGLGAYAALTWCKLERTAKGAFDWQYLRDWVDATPGCKRIFVMGAFIPEWASKRTSPVNSGGFGMSGANQGAPADMQDVADFIEAMFDPGEGGFTADDIHYVEIGNEPKFGDEPNFGQMDQDSFIGGRVVNPFTVDEFDTARQSGGGGKYFFYGTPRELARIAYTVKPLLPTGVKLIGCGWEQTLGTGSPPFTIRDFWALMNADVPGGLKACELFDEISIHPYIYSNDPQIVDYQMRGFRYWLQQLASQLGKPAIADLPIRISEIGHEYGGPARAYTVTQVATTHKRATGIAAMRGATGICWYIDRNGEEVTTYPPSGYNDAEMIAACNYCDAINGQTIRQAAWKPSTGEVWLRFQVNQDWSA